MPKTAIVILARGGSRRIPKKNIVPFNGKPLIEYTIEDALNLNLEVWVFTDMQEIRDLCKKYNVNVRDKKYESTDGIHKTHEELIEYNKEIKADNIILLQITSPLRDVSLMNEWIKKFIDGDYDTGFAAHQLKQAFYYNIDAKPLNYNLDDRNHNSNVKSSIFIETGSFYIFKVSQLDKNHFINTDNKIIFSDPYDVDIDNLEDLLRCKSGKNKL